MNKKYSVFGGIGYTIWHSNAVKSSEGLSLTQKDLRKALDLFSYRQIGKAI
jgi:hypothetical protein